MSLNPTLKIRGSLSRHRNVLSRAERIEMLQKEDRWEDGDSVTGLPKVAHRKGHSGKKASDTEAKTEVAAEQTEDTNTESTS